MHIFLPPTEPRHRPHLRTPHTHRTESRVPEVLQVRLHHPAAHDRPMGLLLYQHVGRQRLQLLVPRLRVGVCKFPALGSTLPHVCVQRQRVLSTGTIMRTKPLVEFFFLFFPCSRPSSESIGGRRRDHLFIHDRRVQMGRFLVGVDLLISLQLQSDLFGVLGAGRG